MHPSVLVRRLAAKLGATLDTTCGEVNVEAPHGKVWLCDGVHELVNSPFDSETQRDMWTLALSRMQSGLEDCPHGDTCEWCYPAIGES